MKIIGIDPGYAIVGCSVLEKTGNSYKVIYSSAITTSSKMTFADRIKKIYEELKNVIKLTSPDMAAIEKLYFAKNTKTAIDVAQARGSILLTFVEQNLPIYEYTPLQVKQSIIGYGRATKKQIQLMVQKLLALKTIPKPDDVADAMAIAICHGNSYKLKKISGMLGF